MKDEKGNNEQFDSLFNETKDNQNESVTNKPTVNEGEADKVTTKDEAGFGTEGHTATPAADAAGTGETVEESAERQKEASDKDNETMDLYDINKGLLKRDGGPYLDEVERERAEIVRAKKEDRDADLENPPATAGTVLVPKAYLRETDASNGNNSAYAELENEPEDTVPVYNPEEAEPDPTQVDWDNDHQKVLAVQAKAAQEDATKQLKTNGNR